VTGGEGGGRLPPGRHGGKKNKRRGFKKRQKGQERMDKATSQIIRGTIEKKRITQIIRPCELASNRPGRRDITDPGVPAIKEKGKEKKQGGIGIDRAVKTPTACRLGKPAGNLALHVIRKAQLGKKCELEIKDSEVTKTREEEKKGEVFSACKGTGRQVML